MFESMKITRESLDAVDAVSTLDLGEHLLDVGGWIRAARSLTDGGELPARIDRRFITARRTQRLADPFGHAHPMAFGGAADFSDLVIFKQDLQACSHIMSIFDSSQEVKRPGIIAAKWTSESSAKSVVLQSAHDCSGHIAAPIFVRPGDRRAGAQPQSQSRTPECPRAG